MSAVPSVLFVCGRNAIRSPMAEALWIRHFGAAADARSCGVIPAAFVDPFMISVMWEVDCDLEDFSPIALAGIGEPTPQIVVSLSPAADRMAKAYADESDAEFLAWPAPDPSGAQGNRDQRLMAYRESRDAIQAMIENWEKTR
ncbi:low molecular weight phosphatase family protein [Maricaulis sp. D1M11]|uniref:arsenate-mycothiol transferase ArsC n=1 Tax=Maricaulis sp. D1M11 TaxID=3076117 RepID=UPI0039B55B3E